MAVCQFLPRWEITAIAPNAGNEAGYAGLTG